MDIEIKGLKCDNCNYREDDVKFSEYKQNIGRNCPICGTILLTKEEYNNCLMLYKRIELINIISNTGKYINPIFYIKRFLFNKERQSVKIEYPKRKIKKYTNKN